MPVEERGDVHTAYAAIGVDDMNYGITNRRRINDIAVFVYLYFFPSLITKE